MSYEMPILTKSFDFKRTMAMRSKRTPGERLAAAVLNLAENEGRIVDESAVLADNVCVFIRSLETDQRSGLERWTWGYFVWQPGTAISTWPLPVAQICFLFFAGGMLPL